MNNFTNNPIIAQLNKNGAMNNYGFNNLNGSVPNQNTTMQNMYQPNMAMNAPQTSGNNNVSNQAMNQAVEYVKNSGMSAKQAFLKLAQESGVDVNQLFGGQFADLFK